MGRAGRARSPGIWPWGGARSRGGNPWDTGFKYTPTTGKCLVILKISRQKFLTRLSYGVANKEPNAKTVNNLRKNEYHQGISFDVQSIYKLHLQGGASAGAANPGEKV